MTLADLTQSEQQFLNKINNTACASQSSIVYCL